MYYNKDLLDKIQLIFYEMTSCRKNTCNYFLFQFFIQSIFAHDKFIMESVSLYMLCYVSKSIYAHASGTKFCVKIAQ